MLYLFVISYLVFKIEHLQIERRALDFSECGSPEKSKEKGRSSISLASPSSYLLKGCR